VNFIKEFIKKFTWWPSNKQTPDKNIWGLNNLYLLNC
jgi:hypothetical protein